MTQDLSAPSPRMTARVSAKALREANASYRQFSFEALAAGWSIEQIAEMRKVSARTVRREVDRALDERPLEAPHRYARLQAARLTKALRLVDIAIDKGDMRAVGAMVRVVKALDRYHGMADPAAQALGLGAVPDALPAPPLKLTHAEAAPSEAEAEQQFVTDSRHPSH